MSELRLVPAALAVWAASLICVLYGTGPAACAVAVLAVGCAMAGERGQAILVAGLGAASATVASVRVRIAKAWEYGPTIEGVVSGHPKQLESGTWLTRVSVPGHPATLTVFSREVPDTLAPGAHVAATGTLGEAGVAGVNPSVLNGSIEVAAPPDGFAGFAQHVRVTFSDAVAAQVGERTAGLIPGMVLGDTSRQSPAEQQAYIDTGLSHLSAVSGSNVAIVTTSAVVVATLLGLGLRARLAAAAVALLAFAGLVGPEPSVLRASVTGLVGLVAVLASTRAEPIHALCLSVIGLVLVDTDLAVHYGFALSVAATAGIVALYPVIYQALAATGWPDILNRALAVAIAADVATMPIVAMMAGQVSLVSVVANVLVAPVVPVVTVLGLVAALLSLAPGGVEALPLIVIEPLAWWVSAVAHLGASLPGATIQATPAVVLVCYGWVVAGIVAKRVRLTCVAVVVAFAASGAGWAHAPLQPDYPRMRAHVVATKADIEPVPPEAQVVVVMESGPPPRRPTLTQEGIPVIFPNRGGGVVR